MLSLLLSLSLLATAHAVAPANDSILKATVLTDGSLASGAEKGSIHSLGAKLQGASACNGWTFWHIEHEGELKPVDALRQLYLLATED